MAGTLDVLLSAGQCDANKTNTDLQRGAAMFYGSKRYYVLSKRRAGNLNGNDTLAHYALLGRCKHPPLLLAATKRSGSRYTQLARGVQAHANRVDASRGVDTSMVTSAPEHQMGRAVSVVRKKICCFPLKITYLLQRCLRNLQHQRCLHQSSSRTVPRYFRASREILRREPLRRQSQRSVT